MKGSRRTSIAALVGAASALSIACLASPRAARAGDFDDAGHFIPNPNATAFEDFVAPTRYLPSTATANCSTPAYMVQEDPTALSGTTSIHLKETDQQCQERFEVSVPATQASYKASVWVRHGTGDAQITVAYADDLARPLIAEQLAPTGRATSDGWVELASNDFPVDGTAVGMDGSAPHVYLRIYDEAAADGIDVDALEIVPSGAYVPEMACEGVRDPVCGADAECLGGRCVKGDWFVPPLPTEGQYRDDMIDGMESQLHQFFGGKKTRTVDLPVAMATLETLRHAKTAWEFWNGWATAIHQLHDWHTDTYGSIQGNGAPNRLNLCFIEGDADLSHGIAPSSPNYRDILVDYTGVNDTQGLHAGDRLVAVDGLHPIAWARALLDVQWGYHVASDSDSFADFPEVMNQLIPLYAKEITVIRCDPATKTCDGAPETLRVKDFTNTPSTGMMGGDNVSCDNRPAYHLGALGPNPASHRVFGKIFHGPVDGTTPDEAIYGMVWDTLNGGGDPNSNVNTKLNAAITEFRTSAKGVILDHRAGNGGTLDSAELMTSWLRPADLAGVIRMPMHTAAYDGPFTAEEGADLVSSAPAVERFLMGGPTPVAFPIALITHRDGSASDYMPFSMKGAPHLKIFGPGPTAGAFSTFIQFNYWGGISFQFASGDTLGADGHSLMGSGVMPDVVVQQKQSDLIQGIDTIHEAALAWIRSENP